MTDTLSMLLTVFLAFSLSIFAQVSTIQGIVDILEKPQEKLTPEGYKIICIEPISDDEWSDLLQSAKKCTESEIENCFKFCSTILEPKFDFSWSEIQTRLDKANLPQSDKLCDFKSPSLEMTSKWLEKKCPAREDKVFKSSELDSYFSKLKTNSTYRMNDDQGLCKQRSFLLAEELVSNGYSPRLIFLTSDTQGLGLNVQSNGKEISYADHWVVIVKDSNGIDQALDPQFMEKNLKLEDYLKDVSPKAPAKLRQMNLHYLVKRLSPSDINNSCKEIETEIHALMLKEISN